ncbi:ATP-binding cassette domain-containing protein [Hornefia butyriciproducens]|uniref:ATP-binding cassette domain-containing protein n=1 Tax=Hornefia butyriciproducens TaxID=2652293 RepID=UPI002A91D844|nr:ATP-binding cassette domain-containing protein [Hornefia butyriciproducens]MCI7413065.1 ATP-binding cassette domain-containing protein [Clostridiales bacterium]MCI7679626.1 ATP-binding cassette domain-containing protein [Clostridiales bacterium]MDY5462583.1 ATP-binding cassette domain-containing protein [Hornefia butyriciproducens]MDY6211115.1 ATP-binding cassette domain-containing protein [Hornefia butyriciproducens]
MIEGKNICKKFEDRILFHEYNFLIEDGEFVCFSGRSGCGKTTLLNMIGMIEPVDSGEIRIDGKNYLKNRQKIDYFRNKVGFLFQNFALVETWTVKENLEMIPKKYRTEYTIENVLQMVGMQEQIDHPVYTLSGGEQQRIAIARLLLKKCDIVLADEPTGSLDSINALNIMKMLKKMNYGGKTIVLVTHDSDTRRMADRVVEIG